MKITGIVVESIPSLADEVVSDGFLYKRDGTRRVLDSTVQIRAIESTELENGLWIGLDYKSDLQFIILADEWAWRVEQAQHLLNTPKGDPMLLFKLKAAARIVDLNVPKLLELISSSRSSGESLHETFRRLIKK